MVVIIRDHYYSSNTLKKLKEFAFSLEIRDYPFECKSENIRCNRCLVCKLELVTNRDDLDELTQFPAFIGHKASEGGYVLTSRMRKGFLNNKNIFLWGDLEQLKQEVKAIHRQVIKMPKHLHQSWKKFYEDVMSSVELLELRYF